MMTVCAELQHPRIRNTARLLRAAALAALAVILSACAGLRDEAPRAKSVTDARQLQGGSAFEGVSHEAAWPTGDWWKRLGDPQLDALIADGLAGNPTLRLAQARIDAARSQVMAADSRRKARLDANASITYERLSETDLFPPPLGGSYYWESIATLNFSYEFDFWHRNKEALNAALARADAERVDAAAARMLLASAIARAYVEFDRLSAQRETLAQIVALREDMAHVAMLRARAGLATDVEIRQFSAAAASAKAEQAGLDSSLALIRNALASLAGAGPERGGRLTRPQLHPDVALALPSALPADLIGRRPDVIAERLRVQAAASGIKSARAQFYPNIDLMAYVGVQGLSVHDMTRGGSGILGIGPAFNLPLFDGDRLRANLAARDADYDYAVAQYDATLLDAVRDVADQVARWRGIEAQMTEQERARADTEAAWRQTAQREKAGLETRLAVLAAATQVAAERRVIADLTAQRLDAAVQLMRALGGGYAAAAADHAAPPPGSTPQSNAAPPPANNATNARRAS